MAIFKRVVKMAAVPVFLVLLCSSGLFAMTIKSKRLSVEIDENIGNLQSIIDQKENQKLVIPSFDYYGLVSSPDNEILADEKEDKVIKKEENKFICRNPKLPQILIEKEYSLENNMLTKKVTFKAEGKDLGGFLKYNTKTNLELNFYSPGYLNNATRHVAGKQMPYIPVENIKKEMQIFDINPKADHHLIIFTNPVIKKGLAQYRFKVDGYFVHPLSSYTYEPGLYYGPEGWRMAVAAKWLSNDRPLFSCEVRWHLFEGDHLNFHQQYLDIPEFKEMWDTKVPEWMRDIKVQTGVGFWETSPRALQKIKAMADALDSGYILVMIRSLFTNVRDYTSDPILTSTGVYFPVNKLRELVDTLHNLSPKIKVGPMTWMWGFGEKDPIFLKHPEWTVHDGQGKPVFCATGWEGEPVYLQLLTPECREFLIKQFQSAVKKYNFDFIYMDSGQGGVTNFDWSTKNSAQDYDWALLYKGIRDAIRVNNGGTFFNGMPNIFSLYSDLGFYEGVGIFQRDNWQALSDRLLLGKLYQKPASKRVIPIYWRDNVKESYAKNCYVLGLKGGEFQSPLSSRWPITSALKEIEEAVLVPEAEVSPCWWKEKTDIEAYGLKLDRASFLTFYNHSSKQEDVNLSANLRPFNFESNKPINLWYFKPKGVKELEDKVVATEAEVAEIFQKEGRTPLRGVDAFFMSSFPYPKDGKFTHPVKLESEEVLILMLTQAEELAYAKDGKPTHFLLPASGSPSEKTVKANRAIPEEIKLARNWIFPMDKKKIAPSSPKSSPATVNFKSEKIERTIKGVKVLQGILIDCEHNMEDTATIDIDNLILTVNMGEEKIWGFASSAIESSNLGKVKLAITSIEPFEYYKNLLTREVVFFAGLVADYKTEKGYTRRVYFPFYYKPEKFQRPWYGYFNTAEGKEEPILVNLSDKITPGKETILELDLGEYAPKNWNGYVIFGPSIEVCELSRGIKVQILENGPAGKPKKVEEIRKEIVLFKDDFSLELEDWETIAGEWRIENEEYHQTGAQMDARVWNKKLELPQSYIYEAKVKTIESDWVGIMFGMQDENNGYMLWISAYEANPQTALQKMVDKTRSDLLPRLKEPHSKNQWYTLKVVVDGNSIKAFIDDNLKYNIKDESFSRGKIGLWTYKNHVSFDDVIVKKFGEEPVKAAQPAKTAEMAGTPFHGGAMIHKFEKGAKLEEGTIYIPVDGAIEATGLAITTIKISRENQSTQLELLLNYEKNDGKIQSYKYSLSDIKPGTEKEINLDINQFAPPDWNKRVRLELKGNKGSVRITFNSSFQIY